MLRGSPRDLLTSVIFHMDCLLQYNTTYGVLLLLAGVGFVHTRIFAHLHTHEQAHWILAHVHTGL